MHTDKELTSRLAAMVQFEEGMRVLGSRYFQEAKDKFEVGLQLQHSDEQIQQRLAAALHLAQGEMRLVLRLPEDLERACSEFKAGEEGVRDADPELEKRLLASSCLADGMRHLHDHRLNTALLAFAIGIAFGSEDADLNQRLAAARCLVEGELCLQQRDFDAAAIRFQDGVEVEATQSDTDLAKRLRTALALAQGEQELKLMKFSEAAVSLQRGQEYVHTDKELTSRLAAMVQFAQGECRLASQDFDHAEDFFREGVKQDSASQQRTDHFTTSGCSSSCARRGPTQEEIFTRRVE